MQKNKADKIRDFILIGVVALYSWILFILDDPDYIVMPLIVSLFIATAIIPIHRLWCWIYKRWPAIGATICLATLLTMIYSVYAGWIHHQGAKKYQQQAGKPLKPWEEDWSGVTFLDEEPTGRGVTFLDEEEASSGGGVVTFLDEDPSGGGVVTFLDEEPKDQGKGGFTFLDEEPKDQGKGGFTFLDEEPKDRGKGGFTFLDEE